MKRFTRVLVVSALATATLSACADDGGHDMNSMGGNPAATTSTAGPSASASHNDADVAFATYMIPHHAQAVAMAEMVPSRSGSQEVKNLAAQIQAAQAPEITQLSGFLEAWGEPVPPASGMQHGDGMMTMEEMGRLETATGAAFDRMWVEMMVEHHDGAIAMARTQLTEGSDAEAKRLAQAIVDGQSKEIATMRSLLTAR